MKAERRILLLTGGQTAAGSAKTAINMLRYRPESVAGVLDPSRRGMTCQEAFGLGGSIPVLGAVSEAEADTLMVGIAPSGGKLPSEMKAAIVEGIGRGMTIISGLHEFLVDDPELAEAARRHGASLIDVRRNQEREVAHRRGIDERCLRIHTVGQDCNVGKMVVSLELSRALQRAGRDAYFVATGQTGILIAGEGCPVDAVVVDFINGAAERLILAHQHHEILLIEGQGSLAHPRYSAVTLGLLHGCVPDGLILCYEAGRETVSGMDHVRLPSLETLVGLYETMANVMHPCRVVGVALNSRRLTAAEADRERARARDALGLPVCDVLRHGCGDLTEAILKRGEALGKPRPVVA